MSISLSSLSYAEEEKEKERSEEMLAVYLSEESKAGLAAHLLKMGVVQGGWVPPAKVALKSRMDEIDHYVYSPIYGERVAFRLKGLLKSKSGDVVGIGRVSNMSGELFDDDFESSVVLKTSSTAQAHVQTMADMPTLLFRSITVASQLSDAGVGVLWKGTVPGGEVLGVAYEPAADVTVEKFKPDVQLVIDGHICSSKHIDEKGACTFDKAEIPDKVPEEAMKRRGLAQEKGHGQRERPEKESEEADEDGETCSVCRFMKKGPCGAEFKEWDGCVQGLKEGEDLKKCFGLTVAMMTCMKQHEYYDIMTANSEAKMAAINDAPAAPEKTE